MRCLICGSNDETRMGACFTCVELESIISSGLDMYDNGPEDNTPAKTAMQKLLFMRFKHPEYFAK
jgi:hypothetical protein